jgi:hypothetical protein
MPSSSKELEHEHVSEAKPPVASKHSVKPSKTVGSSRNPSATVATKTFTESWTSPTRVATARPINRRQKGKAKANVMAEVQE